MAHEQLDALQSLIEALRSPERGCPWTRAQTFQSLSGYTIEEAYEIADSIGRGDTEHLLDELGDLLYHLLFYAQIAAESNLFSLEDIAAHAVDKHQRRNVILTQETQPSLEAVQRSWEQQKAKEQALNKPATQSIVDNLPINLPALLQANKLQRRLAQHQAENVADLAFCLSQLHHTLAAATEDLQSSPLDEASARTLCGNLLFQCANLARTLNIDPEAALRDHNHAFRDQILSAESNLSPDQTLADLSTDRARKLWLV